MSSSAMRQQFGGFFGDYGALWLTDCIMRFTLDERHEQARIAERIAEEYRKG